MKKKSLFFKGILIASSSLFTITSAYSQTTYTWLGAGDNWGTPGLWNGGIAATGSNNTASFTGINLTTDRILPLGANRTIGNIIFTDDTTSSHDLTLSGASSLTLQATTPTINVTQFDRNLTISATLAGAGGFTKTGQGTLTLSGTNNSITGNTVLSAGKVVLDYSGNDNRKLPTGTLTVNSGGGSIVLKGGTATNTVSSFTNNSTVGAFFERDGGTSKINLNAITIGGSSVVSFSEDSMATTDRTNQVGFLGANFTVGNRWASNSTNGADGNIVGYTGATALNLAALPAQGTGVGTGGSADINYDLSGGGTLSATRQFNTLRIESTADNQTLTLGTSTLQVSNLTGTNAPGSYGGGLLYAGGANGNYTITGTTGRVTMENGNGQTQLINVYTGTLTVDAVVGNGNGSFNKSGAGTLVFNKASGYSGATRVYQGVLRITGAGTLTAGTFVQNAAAIELGNGVNIGNGATLNITGTGISNAGALRSVATTTSSYAAAITIGSGGARINSDSGTLTLTGGIVTAGNTVTLGGAGNTTVSTGLIAGTGGLIKDGTGTTTLSASNTYSGATRVNAGTLSIRGATQNTNAITVANGASLGLNVTSAVTAASAAVSLGGTVSVTGLPAEPLPSYTLLTASSITGTPVLASPIAGYELVVEGGNVLKLNSTTTPVDPYATWSGGNAFASDANADGVANGLAFLLGAASPTATATNLLPASSQASGNLTLSFTMLNAASRGTSTLTLEHSSDLGVSDAWSSVTVPDTSGTVSGISFTVTPGSPLNTVTATIPASEAVAGKVFGRLKAETP